MSPTFFHRILPCESVLPRQARAPVRHAWGTGVSERSLRSSSSKSASQVHPVHPEVDVAKPKSSKSSQSSKSSRSSWSRIDDALMTEEYLNSFLDCHGFRDAHSSDRRCGGCFGCREVLYPIHVAARLGDAEVVKLLLAAGVDPAKESSHGHTAAEMAEMEDVEGSHAQVLFLLELAK